jgi:hypothetical protein
LGFKAPRGYGWLTNPKRADVGGNRRTMIAMVTPMIRTMM